MATEHDGAKVKEEFRRRQWYLRDRISTGSFPRFTWIVSLVGVMLLCFTLSKIPKVQGGLPLALNREQLISFAVGSGIGIFLHLLVFFLYLLAYINEGNLNKTQSPSLELIEKCLRNQNKLIFAIRATEELIPVLSPLFRTYVMVVAVSSAIHPYVDANTNTGTCYLNIGYTSTFFYLFKLLPEYWNWLQNQA